MWIPRENVCDGYFDCRDKSDEEGCNKTMVSCEVRLGSCDITIDIMNNFPAV